MLKNLLYKIEKLRSGELEGFEVLKEHIQSLDEFQYQQIVERLKFQIELVEKYKPKVRPAIDPMVSTELGIYRRLDDFEIGKLLDYPECCIKSFVEDVRVAIDREHLKEVEEMKEELKNKGIYAIVLPSGFIPCSLKCEEAIKRGFIGYLTKEEFDKILELEKELKEKIRHWHFGYDEYYEKIILP
ncbi:conserved hypothetical protein [Methanocaldococcus jannaschii DSM 2661]|uniref:Uncharacterized protein MJ1106 n=1 Tax=Methanocaldococcus jannaschii (strain ATCC 43067 / DSM 2661 / JAL-1 / JCM 10045 / NBRC 100440) TaxID=243232 RepID=Y1106_METJA|nr:DUF483 domain-containing protein [Methanocaldococcus jannaschii]Q58506.1 RecName: Full=Uncharacterized protein MJ1106 [Methanocaldococcus jannaschii DSM 2661]AAB99109.1 conserved hypothetical protein [Methanocaldococcus jannaschii DSM 2661]